MAINSQLSRRIVWIARVLEGYLSCALMRIASMRTANSLSTSASSAPQILLQRESASLSYNQRGNFSVIRHHIQYLAATLCSATNLYASPLPFITIIITGTFTNLICMFPSVHHYSIVVVLLFSFLLISGHELAFKGRIGSACCVVYTLLNCILRCMYDRIPIK